MSVSANHQVTAHDISNTKHVLRLLQSQVKTGRIDAEYMLKQLSKVGNMLDKLEEIRNSSASTDRFEALYNISRILGTSLDQQTVLNQVMDAVIQLTRAERGFLMLRDDDGDLNVKVARNLDQQSLSSEEFKYSRSVVNFVMEKGEAVLTTNALEDPRFAGKASVVNQALRSIMATPLRIRGNVIGIAYVENRVVSGLFTEENLETLEAVAAQAAVAIDNALLFSATDAELSRRVNELSELRRIDLKLNEKLDLDEVILYTLELICRLSGASSGQLGMLLDDNPDRVIAVHQYADGKARVSTAIFLDDIYPQIKNVIKNKQAITFDSGQYGLNTVFIAPIIGEGDVTGTVVLRRQDGGAFSAEQREFIGRIISRAAVAIENARLYAAVQAADKAKSEFVGIVAHDLKAPMTSIRGYADLMLMEREKIDERHQRFLENITGTVRRMEILVSDLADISRIESGQFFMNEMCVGVGSIADALRNTTLPEMQARKHNYVEQIEDNLPDMWVDYFRLIQVLTNLMSNAYKYTPDEGTITLRIARQGNRIYFEVEDTGIGMSQEDVDKLGTKFWRAEDEYTRSQSGTGLGFTITAALVSQMGSEITIYSMPGEGSRFGFSVAIATDEQCNKLAGE